MAPVRLLIRRPPAAPAPTQANDSAGESTAGLEEGQAVEGNLRGRGKWCPGEISKVNGDGTFNIAYNAGDREESVAAVLIRRVLIKYEVLHLITNGPAQARGGGRDWEPVEHTPMYRSERCIGAVGRPQCGLWASRRKRHVVPAPLPQTSGAEPALRLHLPTRQAFTQAEFAERFGLAAWNSAVVVRKEVVDAARLAPILLGLDGADGSEMWRIDRARAATIYGLRLQGRPFTLSSCLGCLCRDAVKELQVNPSPRSPDAAVLPGAPTLPL